MAWNYSESLVFQGKAGLPLPRDERRGALWRTASSLFHRVTNFKPNKHHLCMQSGLNIPWLLRGCGWQGSSVSLDLMPTPVPSAVGWVGGIGVISPSSLTRITLVNVRRETGPTHTHTHMSAAIRAALVMRFTFFFFFFFWQISVL